MQSCLNPVQHGPCASDKVAAQRSSDGASWFCIRTHPKHEHIAAAQLRQEPDIEVFLPRIRYRRSTRCGPAWVAEALFRDYLFARFDLAQALRRVRHARAVHGVVHFGGHWPSIPDRVIVQLQAAMGGKEVRVIEDALHPGDLVQIAEGAMFGLEAVVTRVMPARQRVAVLLEFLGRQTTVVIARDRLTFPSAQESQRVRTPIWELPEEVGLASI
jgi:transcriptional antiterminator RfaH